MNTIALYHEDSNYINALISEFKSRLPNHRIVAWEANLSADYLLSWKPDSSVLTACGAKVIFALGAGVDAFLAANLPEGLPIVRLEEAGMGAQMLEMALYGILHYSRDMSALRIGQQNQQWLGQTTPKNLPFSTKVGVMGLGQLGQYVATHLTQLGYPVSGYSRSCKTIYGVTCYDDNATNNTKGFDAFLAQSEVLINLLPLTPETENRLNSKLFAKMPKGGYVINIARGKHLVEEDLTQALDNEQLSGALLDVFRVEPLPDGHSFWQDSRITITPHLAAITLQGDAVEQISRNILAFEAGDAMTGVVNRARGY